MDAVDLTRYGYTQELADDFKRRTVGKIIVSTFFKKMSVYKPKIEKLMDRIELEVGVDWFDYAFMEKKSNVVVLNFIRHGITRDTTPISFNDNCLREERFSDVISMIRNAKEVSRGN